MHKAASRRNRMMINRQQGTLLYGNFDEFAVSEMRYDLVYLNNVIYFWEKYNDQIIKIKKMLKPDGQILIAMLRPNVLEELKTTKGNEFNKHQIKDVVDCLRENGYQGIEVRADSRYEGFVYITGRN